MVKVKWWIDVTNKIQLTKRVYQKMTFKSSINKMQFGVGISKSFWLFCQCAYSRSIRKTGGSSCSRGVTSKCISFSVCEIFRLDNNFLKLTFFYTISPWHSPCLPVPLGLDFSFQNVINLCNSIRMEFQTWFQLPIFFN